MLKALKGCFLSYQASAVTEDHRPEVVSEQVACGFQNDAKAGNVYLPTPDVLGEVPFLCNVHKDVLRHVVDQLDQPCNHKEAIDDDTDLRFVQLQMAMYPVCSLDKLHVPS